MSRPFPGSAKLLLPKQVARANLSAANPHHMWPEDSAWAEFPPGHSLRPCSPLLCVSPVSDTWHLSTCHATLASSSSSWQSRKEQELYPHGERWHGDRPRTLSKAFIFFFSLRLYLCDRRRAQVEWPAKAEGEAGSEPDVGLDPRTPDHDLSPRQTLNQLGPQGSLGEAFL